MRGGTAASVVGHIAGLISKCSVLLADPPADRRAA
jgi:hypothetical protein